jgi:hypothetical protein
MTGHWLSFAQAQHKNLEIPLDQLLKAYELVQAAMGDEWLQREQRKDEGGKTLVAFHPLYRDLNSCTNQALVIVAELAVYLSAFASDPALAGIIKDLRSDKFVSTFFELAMAYRWKQAGAVVALQPVTPKGIADFEAVIDGRRYVVECSICPDDLFGSLEFRLPLLLGDLLADLDAPFAFAAKLTVHEYPKEEWQSQLRKVAKKGAHELLRQHKEGGPGHVVEDHGAWRLELEIVTAATEPFPGSDDWTHAHRVISKPTTPGQPVYKLIDEKRGSERARLFFKPPRDAKSTEDVVVDKFKREARQLRGIADGRIVMLDISSVAPDVLEIAQDHVIDAIRRHITDIPEMPCVWLMSRGWSTALRFQYRAIYLENGACSLQLPEAFFTRVGSLEWKHDFITDRPITSNGRDEDVRNYERRSQPRE